MSRGCVIIAHNDCTMNEYIKNGVNGYLINFDKPKKIHFKEYETLYNNSIKMYEDGRNEYINKLSEVVKFIDKNNNQKRYNCGCIIAYIYFIIKKSFLNIFHK